MASREKHADTSFWDWLSGNTARLRPGLARGSKRAAEEITREFDKSYEGLVWEVTPADKGPWVFCVSANGDKKLFSRVERAAAAAPRMKDWTVQAFRPRGPAEAEITLNGQSLDGDDVWCEIESVKRGGAVSLVLHLRRVTLETEEVLSQAALILLDNAIGEYDSVMRVAGIDLALLEGKPKRSDRFFPLRDLPAFWTARAKGRHGWAMDLLDRLLGHDAWTTREMLLRCRHLTDEQLDRDFDIGHRTLRRTFIHIVWNMEVWTDLMAGVPQRPNRNDDPAGRSILGLIDRLDLVAQDFAALARGIQREGRLDEIWVDTLDDPPTTKSYGAAIAHVLTHSMHHRAQVLYLMRLLGVTDLIEGDVLSWENHLRREGRSTGA